MNRKKQNRSAGTGITSNMTSLISEPTTVKKRSPRERILRAAKHLFAKQGFEHTSTMAISRAAQTSETQLIKNFGSKQGLLEAIFDEDSLVILEKLRDLDTNGMSPVEQLRRLVRMAVEHLDRDPDAKALLAIEHGRVRRKLEHKILISAGYQETCELIDRTLEEMGSAGQIRADLQPRVLRSSLFGIILQLWRDQLRTPECFEHSSEQITAMTDAFIAGLSLEASRPKCADSHAVESSVVG